MDIVLCCFRFVVANVRIIADTSYASTKFFTRRYAFLTFPEVSVPITTLTYIYCTREKHRETAVLALRGYATKANCCFSFFYYIFA